MLDGPFILNEILQWCTKKKKKTLIFKVDFEKAFDSIRWDFLDDVLKEFGFRCKWRNWIQSCLTSSKGSILVNGCPTNEFQFYKGLKQGDPLSPFLFILVMESLHLSFQRIVNAGMFKGIVLDQSLCLSHMFYADDAIFLGEWSDGNISTLIHVLKCFFHASGLKINLNKSKIMGINVESAQVIQAAAKLGCLVLKCPFYYLGTRVGGSMTRVQAWQEIVEKVKSRLSKWKSKTLSIGGRLTLLKSVLGSIPVFHMSIFKVPSKVLHILESIRSHFFNGHDPGSKKASWVKWNNVLTDKKRGGLGVSSLFALNRGLMIKWVWKFLSQKDSLWTKVIVAIHGVGGKIHSEWTSTGKSCWLSILSEVRSLQRKGMYVFDYLTHKMGNGESTKFWLDHWHTRGIFKDIFPRLYALESSKDVTVSSKIGDTSLVSALSIELNLESTVYFRCLVLVKRIDEICPSRIMEKETRWVKLGSIYGFRQISRTEAEYVAAASCCAQVLWIQNQLLDYGFNFMNTKIFIDNQSTICIVKNPVFHQRTKHIEIRHHFIRDANEKNLIQVLKIHTDDNVADLLTKAFDGPRFEYLVVHIGMVDMVLVSAGSTMILLGVILPAGCFVSAGSYGLCCWFRVHAGRHTSPGGFISADRVFVYAVNTSFYAAELVCAGSIMFLLAELFLLVVTCLCCLNLVSAVLSLILLVGWSLPLVTQFLLVVSIPAGVSMYLLNE
ncbi:RNA-directed DNA polymerase, eukaryota, reverse transcriptase zinc-binding domain protein [Tanacetum coccineum]